MTTIERVIKEGKQINGYTFRLGGIFYAGRVEEARKYYIHHAEIYTQFLFEEYVKKTYTEIHKPKEAIKQEIIDLCEKYLSVKETTELLFLLNKL